MSPTPRLLAILLALTASSSLALLWKLHQAQQRIASLQASRYDTAAAPSMAGAVRVPPSAVTASAGSSSDAGPATQESVSAGATPPNPADDPEFASAELISTRLTLMQEHPDLAQALQLSPAEASAMLDILAQTRLARSQRIPTAVAKDREEAGLRALLGTERYIRWQDHQRNAPLRKSVAQVNASLSANGLQPLSEAQARSLLSALATERDRRDAEFSRAAAGLNTAEPGFLQDFRDVSTRADEDMIQRIAVAAAGDLSPDQMSALRMVLEEPLRQQLRERKVRETR